jgi:hypothetical protein
MVILIMNSIHNFKEIKRLTMIMTHLVERFHEDVINQRRHQAKGVVKLKVNETTDTTQTWN